jgi:hypothetical protein
VSASRRGVYPRHMTLTSISHTISKVEGAVHMGKPDTFCAM